MPLGSGGVDSATLRLRLDGRKMRAEAARTNTSLATMGKTGKSVTKTMAKQLAPHINVNTVAPGHTNTEMIKSLPEEIRKNMIEGSYLKRLAKPQEIAKAILFLASNDADFITGQLLLVDGGFSLK